jgi:3-phosphoshikimate 1-carboxyvinyltransferase
MIKIKGKSDFIHGIIPLTPSKSIMNRVLIINALSAGRIEISNEATAQDSTILKSVLDDPDEIIDVKDSGTAFRFLTAYLSTINDSFILTGNDRMNHRPVGKLVEALTCIGADIEFLKNRNYPPLKIKGGSLTGGSVTIDASESSQFISALLLIAPSLEKGIKLKLSGKLNSRPYILMTLSLMQYFGIEIKIENGDIVIPSQEYSVQPIRIENDWSAASFWYLITALSPAAEITLKGLFKNSIQGDSVIDHLMKNFGVDSVTEGDNLIISKNNSFRLPEHFEYDFSSCPDLVIPLAFLCAAKKVNGIFKGVESLYIKESDRIVAIKNELERTGANVESIDGVLKIVPGESVKDDYYFQSYNDHRMIMAEAAMACQCKNIIIDDHVPVKKSYPEFWEHLQLAGFEIEIN